MSKVIAVWGNEFKTSTAVNIAKRLSNKHKVILVGCDCTKPLLGVVFPRKQIEQKSLGEILNQANVTIDDVYSSLVFDKQDNLGVLGYLPLENQKTYANYSNRRAANLINALKQLADYIVIDCVSDLTNSVLSATAVSLADSNIFLMTPDVNGLSFYQSQTQLLMSLRVAVDSLIKVMVVNNPTVIHDIEFCQKIVGARHKLEIPFSQKVVEQMIKGEIFGKTNDRTYDKAIRVVLRKIKEE